MNNIRLFALFVAIVAAVSMWLWRETGLPASEADAKFYAYQYPLCRAADFLLGVLLYRLWKNRQDVSPLVASLVQVVSLVLLMLAFYYYAQVPDILRFDFFYAVPMAAVIYSFALSNGYFATLLTRRAFITLGEISFAFYMVHQIIIVVVVAAGWRGIIPRFEGAAWGVDVALVLFVLITSLAASWFLFFWFEGNAKRMFMRCAFYLKQKIFSSGREPEKV